MATNIIDDAYEHEDCNLEYILENILSENLSNEGDDDDDDTVQLKQLFNSKLINSCKCSKNCDDISKCFHGGNYMMDKFAKIPELVLSKARNTDLLYECNFECLCNENVNCLNRLVQFGPRKHLKIIESTICQSKGLITTADIPKGAFICEYAGEILTINEARKRTTENERLGKMNYILCLNEIQQGTATAEQQLSFRNITIIDPSRYGNIGRYLNHSCDPNCEIFSIRVDCPIPKICIFSKRFIQNGEELCFHYGGGETQISTSNEKKIPCLCNFENCTKFLPNFPF